MAESELVMAERLAENERDAGIAAARAALRETHPDFDGENCVACGNPVPPERLALEKVRCVECQTAVEGRQRLFGRHPAQAGAR